MLAEMTPAKYERHTKQVDRVSIILKKKPGEMQGQKWFNTFHPWGEVH